MNAKPVADPLTVADALLAWYDVNRRDLPWRAKAGEAADPYRVWLSEVMLQQTTVATVRPRFSAWVARWPDFASLAAADEGDVMAAWAGLGYYARARNLLKAARTIESEHGGELPQSEAALRALPGFGDYTAAAVAAIAFGRAAVVVDANVERVVARLFAVEEQLPAARKAIREKAAVLYGGGRDGDLAQALMDLGATICTSRRPRCLLCPIRTTCAGYASGTPEAFPVRPAKKARPHRYGTIFWLQRGDEVLLVRRPDKGLLGGMRALPTGPWSEVRPGVEGAPAVVDWTLSNTTVEHGFTHFTLECALAIGRVGAQEHAGGEWWPIARLDEAGLPTLFAKAAAVMERMT